MQGSQTDGTCLLSGSERVGEPGKPAVQVLGYGDRGSSHWMALIAGVQMVNMSCPKPPDTWKVLSRGWRGAWA